MTSSKEYFEQYVRPEEFGSSLYDSLKHFDNGSYVAYMDTRDNLTFGPGVLVDDRLKKLLGKKTVKVGDKAPRGLIDRESLSRWDQSVASATSLRGLTESRYPVAEMIYQMGLPKVLKFQDTLSTTDPVLAEQYALDSDWGLVDSPKRAGRVARRLRESMTAPAPRSKPAPPSTAPDTPAPAPRSKPAPPSTAPDTAAQPVPTTPDRDFDDILIDLGLPAQPTPAKTTELPNRVLRLLNLFR
jgi:predicted component of type VI protein secretion system